MNPWLLLIPGLALFCLGSFYSYSKEWREHWSYMPVFVVTSILGGILWVIASQSLGKSEDHIKQLMLFSLLWDALMIVAYYALPLFLKGEGFGWQVYAAATMFCVGILWFKLAT